MGLRCEAGAKTDIGRVRRSNQDCYGVDEDLGIYLVCDGMGGAAGGEIASHLAMETFLQVARQEIACDPCDPQERTLRALRRGVRAANRAVIERATWEMPLRGMGSTLVAVRIEGSHATFIHVGDSRAYLARGGVVTQITEDHSVVAEQVRLGLMGEDDAERSPMRSVITRAIGAEVDVQPELSALDLQADDALLLVSDGLTRHLGREDIALVLHQETGAQLACERMIALANERGGSDNVTCVLLRFLEENVS